MKPVDLGGSNNDEANGYFAGLESILKALPKEHQGHNASSHENQTYHEVVGCMKYIDGTFYEGYWRNGRRSGYGLCMWMPCRILYIGNFSGGAMSGYGMCVFPSGAFFIGSFRHNRCHGDGWYLPYNGTWLCGIWKKGVLVQITGILGNQKISHQGITEHKEELTSAVSNSSLDSLIHYISETLIGISELLNMHLRNRSEGFFDSIADHVTAAHGKFFSESQIENHTAIHPLALESVPLPSKTLPGKIWPFPSRDHPPMYNKGLTVMEKPIDAAVQPSHSLDSINQAHSNDSMTITTKSSGIEFTPNSTSSEPMKEILPSSIVLTKEGVKPSFLDSQSVDQLAQSTHAKKDKELSLFRNISALSEISANHVAPYISNTNDQNVIPSNENITEDSTNVYSSNHLDADAQCDFTKKSVLDPTSFRTVVFSSPVNTVASSNKISSLSNGSITAAPTFSLKDYQKSLRDSSLFNSQNDLSSSGHYSKLNSDYVIENNKCPLSDEHQVFPKNLNYMNNSEVQENSSIYRPLGGKFTNDLSFNLENEVKGVIRNISGQKFSDNLKPETMESGGDNKNNFYDEEPKFCRIHEGNSGDKSTSKQYELHTLIFSLGGKYPVEIFQLKRFLVNFFAFLTPHLSFFTSLYPLDSYNINTEREFVVRGASTTTLYLESPSSLLICVMIGCTSFMVSVILFGVCDKSFATDTDNLTEEWLGYFSPLLIWLIITCLGGLYFAFHRIPHPLECIDRSSVPSMAVTASGLSTGPNPFSIYTYDKDGHCKSFSVAYKLLWMFLSCLIGCCVTFSVPLARLLILDEDTSWTHVAGALFWSRIFRSLSIFILIAALSFLILKIIFIQLQVLHDLRLLSAIASLNGYLLQPHGTTPGTTPNRIYEFGQSVQSDSFTDGFSGWYIMRHVLLYLTLNSNHRARQFVMTMLYVILLCLSVSQIAELVYAVIKHDFPVHHWVISVQFSVILLCILFFGGILLFSFLVVSFQINRETRNHAYMISKAVLFHRTVNQDSYAAELLEACSILIRNGEEVSDDFYVEYLSFSSLIVTFLILLSGIISSSFLLF